jgi:hypothetical protein
MRTRQFVRVGVVLSLALGALTLGRSVALAGPAVAGMAPVGMDVTSVTAMSPNNSSDEKSVTAYCPAGTRVLGGGAVMGGNIDVHITGMLPDPVANSFTAYAREHGPGNWPWHVTAHAICAPAPPGLVYVAAFTGGDSAASRSDYAWCPAGTKVLGVGGRVTSADTSRVFLTYLKPTGTGNGAELGAVEMQGGYAGNWWLHSWAVCATEPAGWDVVAAANEDGKRYATLLCPYPKRFTGGGAYISASLGEIYLTMIRIDLWATPGQPGPDSGGRTGPGGEPGSVFPGGVAVETSWIGRGADGPGHEWYLKAYGVCVD